MQPRVRILLISVVAIVAAHLGDRWAFGHLLQSDVYDHDVGRMFRVAGYLPAWLLAALAYWLVHRDRRRALMIGLIPALAGAICALLQLLLRRERPALHNGEYYFRPFSDRPFHGTEFGLPSSHAMVAFAGAWLLCRIYPRAWAVWLLVAAGCAWSRVAAQAHFLSDVTVAAVAAYFVVAWSWRVLPPRAPEHPAPLRGA